MAEGGTDERIWMGCEEVRWGDFNMNSSSVQHELYSIFVSKGIAVQGQDEEPWCGSQR